MSYVPALPLISCVTLEKNHSNTYFIQLLSRLMRSFVESVAYKRVRQHLLFMHPYSIPLSQLGAGCASKWSLCSQGCLDQTDRDRTHAPPLRGPSRQLGHHRLTFCWPSGLTLCLLSSWDPRIPEVRSLLSPNPSPLASLFYYFSILVGQFHGEVESVH